MPDAASDLKTVVVKAEIKLEPNPGDDPLNSRELQQFELFRRLKRPINVDKFPGSIVLRRYRRGDVVCRQGEAGNTAFYIPTAADIADWKSLKSKNQDRSPPSADTTPVSVLTAYVLKGTTAARRRGFWKSVFAPKRRPSIAELVAIPNDGPADIDPTTRTAPLIEGDVFGEMSCMTFAPRSATIVANQNCRLIEFNRNIFDQLQKDQNYREWIDTIYVERVLNTHLRRLEIFSDLTDDQLQQLREAVTLEVVDPGTIICEEGEAPQGKPLDVLVIRSGVVQVVQNAGFSLGAADINWKTLCEQLVESAAATEEPPISPQTVAVKTPKPTSSTADTLEAARKKKAAATKSSEPTTKHSTADILSAARKTKPPADPGSPAKKPVQASTAEILAAARARKSNQADASPTKDNASSAGDKKKSTEDILQALRSKQPQTVPSPADGGPKPTAQPPSSTAGSTDAAASQPASPPTSKPSATTDILAAARARAKSKPEQAPQPAPVGTTDSKSDDGSETSSPADSHREGSEGVPAVGGPRRQIAFLRSSPPKQSGSPQQLAYFWLSDEVQDSVRKIAQGAENTAFHQNTVIKALEALIRTRDFLGAKQLEALFQRSEVARRIAAFPKGVKGIKRDWSELEIRIAGRSLLSEIFPGAVRTASESTGAPRVLAYMSRGDCFGELSVVRDEPRTASCIAYDHPADGSGRKPGRVELVRIAGDAFQKLMQESPVLSGRVQKLAASRTREVVTTQLDSAAVAMTSSPEFQDLGLFQGSKLMLIDLDSCTRCGECVKACVETHDDGYTRLYLDGPRIGRFLIPSACRSCLNPSCMIGCPVGSITRGDNGQIEIHDWCIGCGLCAQQCPYDSIQMHDLGLIPEQSLGWSFCRESSLKRPERWIHSKVVSGNWASGMSPFFWSEDLQRAADVPDPTSLESLCFRHQFDVDRIQRGTDRFRLLVTTPAIGVCVWLNGHPIELGQSPPQKKRGQWEVEIDGHSFRKRSNLLAIQLKPDEPYQSSKPLLSVRLDLLPQAGETSLGVLKGDATASLELVTERAAVCDLCSSLPSQEPACVTSCPHNAAMRVNPLIRFPA